MAAKKRASLLHDLGPEDGWREVSWTARSLLAAAGVSVCVLLTVLSGTDAAQRAESARKAGAALADEAALAAELAEWLAAETATVRRGIEAPRLKPAKSTDAIYAERGDIGAFVDFDFGRIELAYVDAEERRCLAEAIYYEAGSESRLGQLAVADVVLNRVADPRFPSSICSVVYQGAERRKGCQFSFVCDGSMERRRSARKWTQAEELAGAVLAGMRLPVSRNATHYHAAYVSPPWSQTLAPTAAIGLHRFYKFPSKPTVIASAEGT